ncbi:MAG: response regulator [Chloroflexi bacterium]|nr:response regulator [Chloroflexota bacterium]
MATRKVLVVDDSPTDLILMAEPLRADGFEVITAADGQEAITKARVEQPHLIVLDVVLPKANGFQVCRTLKGSPESRNIPIILLTNKREEFDRYWGMRQGADRYLTKPFGGAELLASVRAVLAERAP